MDYLNGPSVVFHTEINWNQWRDQLSSNVMPQQYSQKKEDK